MIYYVSKTYGHDLGWSATYRQWRAESHCRYLHGYPLAIRLTFAAAERDERGWVVDFGGLGSLRAELASLFDHVTLVASDDPLRDEYDRLHEAGLLRRRIVTAVGCEAFCELVWDLTDAWLVASGHSGRVWVDEITVAEHGANSATLRRKKA